MGVVYKATDTKLGRTVALKFLPPQWSHDDSAKQRFQREAQAASATNHRNICVIHDIEQTDDGRLFIVMAHYEGQTLKQKLEDGPLALFDALEIASGIAEGLAKAHAQGVVHRDIKPGNLIVSADGVRIVDFGLATFADAVKLTIEGSTIGTVAYMSPEQARGEEADPRSDVWALGVVLYEMLKGEVPFKGAYPEAVFYAIKNEPVPPLRVVAGEMTERLEALVQRALEKGAEKRYQTAREMARDLRLLQGRTVPVDFLSSPPLPPRPLSWWRRALRTVTPVRAVAALAVLLAAAAGSYRWFTRPIVRIPVAIAPVANHTGYPELDVYVTALTEALIEELNDSPNIRVVSFHRLVEIVRQFVGSGDTSSRDAIQAIATQSGARFVVMPTLEYRDGSWLARAQVRNVETGMVTRSYETDGVVSSLPEDATYRLTSSLADRIHVDFKVNGPGRSYDPRPASSRFRNLAALRAFAEGLAQYEQLEYSAALAAFRRSISEDDQHAITHAWAGRALLVMYQGREAIVSARRARQLVRAETPSTDVAFIDAILAESQADFAAAEKRYGELAALRLDDPTTQIELADFLKRQNREQEAIGAYREALRRDGGQVRPHVDLCQLYTRVDEYPLADQEAQIALEKYRAVSHKSGEAQALLALSELQRRRGDLPQAKQTGQAAREVFESLGLSYGLSRVYQYLGIVAGYSGDYRSAVRFFEEALQRTRDVGNRLTEGVVLNNLGVTYERLAERVKALEFYQQSRDVYRDNGDESHAAEQEANAASLLVDYGSDQPGALLRLNNAHATFRKLGHVEFDVIATEYEAASALHAGRHADARRQLQVALSTANDRHYGNRAVSLTLKLAESYLATGEYDEARARLEAATASDAGHDDPEAAVMLGRVYVRLGEFAAARMRLEPALTAIRTSGQLSILPAAHLALAEVESESGKVGDARANFEKAGLTGTDELPDAASVEARCHQGSIDAIDRHAPKARAVVTASIDRASKMGRLYTEAQCRLQLARIDFAGKQFAQVLAALNALPLEGDRTVGPELEAQIHYWRSRALSEQGHRGDAESEAKQALTLVRALQQSLPPRYRPGFASRREIRRLLEDNPVWERR